MKKIEIKTPYITLGQFLKFVGLISFGGEEKSYLASHEVFINDEADNRRGRKLYPGYKVVIESKEYEICSSEE